MRIELPPPPRKIYIASGLIFVFVAASNVLALLWRGNPLSMNDFWQRLVTAAIFVLLATLHFAVYAARYSVEISQVRFDVVRHVFGFRIARAYALQEISHLRFTHYPNDRRRGVLSFDRKGRTRWLPMVEPDRGGDTLLAHVYAEFPKLSARQKVLNINIG